MSATIEVNIERIDHGNKPHYSRLRCEQNISESMYHTFSETNLRFRCKHTALFLIEGEALCERHAGRKVLEFLLAETEK